MKKNSFIILEEKIDDEIEKNIYQGLSEDAFSKIGHDGNYRQFSFVARVDDIFSGAIVANMLFGGLHLKLLFVNPVFRGNGIGSALINEALEKGKKMGASFAYVETFDFQALDFYKKLGFIEEFTRGGYDKGTTFHYLKRDL